MNRFLRAGIALVLASLALPAFAAEAEQEQEMRPYLSGSFDYLFQDKNRNSDNGMGGAFNAGKAFNQFWGVEFGGFYHDFEGTTGAATQWKEYGGRLGAQFFYSRNPAFSPYFSLGGGGMRTTLRTAPGGNSTDPFADVGLGFFKYFAVNGGPDLGMRADLRYRWVDVDGLPGSPTFKEPVLSVGLVLPLGKRVVPAAAAATTAANKPTAGDADGDGVADNIDKCPGTPAGWVVDADGCPVDSDHDGVPDNLDKCPGTAPGIAVDAKGCPLTPGAAGPDRSFENVNFAFDKSDLTDYAKALLDNAAATINSLTQTYPSLRVDVAGHTDWIGTDAYNQALSEKRANVVKDYLVRKGVDGNRISTFAYGETRPISTNETEEGRALNRRSEVRTHE